MKYKGTISKVYTFRTLLMAFLLCLSLSSCSAISNLSSIFPEKLPWQEEKKGTEGQNEAPPQAPLKVQLSNAYIIDRTILLKIQLELLDTLRAPDTVVAVIGLREGNVIEEQYMILSDVVNREEVTEGERLIIDFSLESGELTEFQVKAFWGEDGRKIITEKITFNEFSELDPNEKNKNPDIQESQREENIPQGSPNLDPPPPLKPESPERLFVDNLRPMQIDQVVIHEEEIPCVKSPCPKRISVQGQLKNSSSQIISDVKLAFGLFWVPQGKLPLIPKDQDSRKPGEEELEFTEKLFAPGESVDFEVAIGRPVHQIPGGNFMPHIRVLTYKHQ